MNRIKELRQKNNLTLRALGEKINMSSSRLSQYETGKREPRLETWQKLANFFGVSVPYLREIYEMLCQISKNERRISENAFYDKNLVKIGDKK